MISEQIVGKHNIGTALSQVKAVIGFLICKLI